MSAYQVKYNGKEYQVYKTDGMATIAMFKSGAEAQSKAAIMNMQWQEQQNRTKRAAQNLIDQEHQAIENKPNKDIPNPTPGQGVHY